MNEGLVKRIENLAQAQHISITMLEEKLGIARGSIRRWREVDPGLSKIKLVAEYFNLTASQLISEDADFSAVKLIASVPEDKRSDLIQYAEFLVSKKN